MEGWGWKVSLGTQFAPTPDCWLSLQVWSAASTFPASWSTPRPFMTLATRAGPGAASPLRRPPRWTCWTGLRLSTPRRCPEVRVQAAPECPGQARTGLECPFLLAGLRLPWLCFHLFPLKPAFFFSCFNMIHFIMCYLFIYILLCYVSHCACAFHRMQGSRQPFTLLPREGNRIL